MTSIFAINTDKMEDSGYDSSEAGFNFGTRFEQYDNLFFSPSFKTVIEKLETNSSAVPQLKNKRVIISHRQLDIHLIMILGIKSFKQLKVIELNFHKHYL